MISYETNKLASTMQKNFILFFRDLGFDLQGHPRSKVMVSNESLIMFPI